MAGIKKIKEGDLWVVDLTLKSYEQKPVGHEQGYQRPCIVLVQNKFAQISTVIPLTTSQQVSRFPHTYLIRASSKNGLKKDSVAMIFQLRGISEKRFLSKIGTLEKKNRDKIYSLLGNYFGI